jgi:hypothetical protein
MTDKVDIVESLKAQCDQLRRLLDAKIWVSEAPKATAEEMAAQVAQLKSLTAQLDQLIQKHRK